MELFRYRLQPLLDQKLERKKEAEEAFAERQNELRAEQERLAQLECTVEELTRKKSQLRRERLSSPARQPLTGHQIQQRTEYLHAVEVDLEGAKDAVFSQRMTIAEAEERVAEARRELGRATREVETLDKHRNKLEERFRREVERKDAVEAEEIGNMLYMRNRRDP
jgi:flagellar biosynthesis chaperone FliJ